MSSPTSVAVFVMWAEKHWVNNLVRASCTAKVGWGAHPEFWNRSIQSSTRHVMVSPPREVDEMSSMQACGRAGRVRPAQRNKVRGERRLLHLTTLNCYIYFCRWPCSVASDFREKKNLGEGALQAYQKVSWAKMNKEWYYVLPVQHPHNSQAWGQRPFRKVLQLGGLRLLTNWVSPELRYGHSALHIGQFGP